jgi:tetratricopeptide (TPR) repeat protein
VYYQAASRLAGPEAERAARIGDCWLSLGRDDQAQASYEAALTLAPRSAPANAGLAVIMHRRADLSAALEHARLAARFQSREWRYREALARLEHEAGHRTESLTEARAAVRLAPPWEQDRLRALVSCIRTAAQTCPTA